MARQSLKNIIRLIESAKEELPVEQDFLNDLKRSIELDAGKGGRKPSCSYKPSSMGCIRSMYYQRIGVEGKKGGESYQLIGICNTGTDTHVRIQTSVAQMRDNGIDCEYVNVAEFVTQRKLDYLNIVSQEGMETKLFHKDLSMSFLCDGIIRYKGHYYILELKTESSFKWQSRKGVDEGHYKQGTAYSIAFGLPEVIFVYINRDTLDMKSYLFVPTDDMKQDLIGQIDTCEQYVNKKQTPPLPDPLPKKACQYCGFAELCRKEV